MNHCPACIAMILSWPVLITNPFLTNPLAEPGCEAKGVAEAALRPAMQSARPWLVNPLNR